MHSLVAAERLIYPVCNTMVAKMRACMQVCRAALSAIQRITAQCPGLLKPHERLLLPAVVGATALCLHRQKLPAASADRPVLQIERLGSSTETVREDAILALLALVPETSAATVLERMGPAWAQKNWRLTTGLIHTALSACKDFDLTLEERHHLVLQPLLLLLADPNR